MAVNFLSKYNDNDFDGGKSQMAQCEKAIIEKRRMKEEMQNRYDAYIQKSLENSPVISVMSENRLYEALNKAQQFNDFAMNVARITEKKLLSYKSDKLSSDIIINQFEQTISELCDIGNLDITHYTYLTVSILYQATWIYGAFIQKWWNCKYLHGEELEVYSEVYDYRTNSPRYAYHVAYPNFPNK